MDNIYEIIIIILYLCSYYGVVYCRKNFVSNLIFIELGYLVINILLIFVAWYINDIKAQIIIIFILALTVIETVVGLVLFLLFFKMFDTMSVEDFYDFNSEDKKDK